MGRAFEVRKEVTLEATPEQVWDAIATGPGLTAWFMPMEMDPDSGTVTAWEPGKRLAVRTPEAPDGSTQAFEYLIEKRGGTTTVLRFIHSGFLADGWDDEYEGMTAKGWDMYLHTLDQYLKHFPGQPATYVEAEAPQSSAERGAWPGLLGALGLSASVATGDWVRLTPAGLDPLDGVVDYRTDDFLGIRTSDALYRFHGRAALGLPIAVGHHVYRPPGSDRVIDGEQTAERWRSWLGAVFA